MPQIVLTVGTVGRANRVLGRALSRYVEQLRKAEQRMTETLDAIRESDGHNPAVAARLTEMQLSRSAAESILAQVGPGRDDR